MEHIVVCVHPFLMKQEVNVYKNGECLKHVECSMEDLAQICYNLSRSYDIHQVDFAGPKDYGLKLEEKMSTNYNNYEITFSFY